MATALEQEGYRILTAPNGAEGLALFGRHKDQIRLVLTDMVMPGMGGCALIENLQQIHPPVRIIVSSGMLDANNADPSSDTVVFLQKPFSGEELIHTVHQALHRASTPSPP